MQAVFVRISRQWGLIEGLLSRFESIRFAVKVCGKRFFVRRLGKCIPQGDKREYSRVSGVFTYLQNKEREGREPR